MSSTGSPGTPRSPSARSSRASSEAFAAWCETEHAVGVSSGTAALELALRGLGIGPGDEVIVPTNSFIATAEAVTATGATPRLVDVDEQTALLTAEIVERALTPRTRCVIPVHLYGRTVDMDPLLDLCRGKGIVVVEDACQAHGARYRGRPVGSLGDAGCFSFYPTKNLGAWGDGGAVVSDDPGLAERVRLLRSHGEAAATTTRCRRAPTASTPSRPRSCGSSWVAWTRRTSAAVLRASRSAEALAGSPVTTPPRTRSEPATTSSISSSCGLLPRDALRDHLDARGIANAIHYPTPIHLQPAYAGLGLSAGSLPVAERLAGRELLTADLPDDRGAGDRANRHRGRELHRTRRLRLSKEQGAWRLQPGARAGAARAVACLPSPSPPAIARS